MHTNLNIPLNPGGILFSKAIVRKPCPEMVNGITAANLGKPDTGSTVTSNSLLHLKTGISYLENNTFLVTGELENHPDFRKYRRIIVPEQEAYAANSLWINGKIIIPSGYEKTRRKIEHAGYPVIETDVSEFRKLDGGLSCLSLRF
jgi:dimethylargininase